MAAPALHPDRRRSSGALTVRSAVPPVLSRRYHVHAPPIHIHLLPRDLRNMWAPAIVALALTALAGLLGVGTAPPAAADAHSFTAAVNAERASAGLPPLTLTTDLTVVAQAWSEHMARTGVLEHNPYYSVQVTGWSMLAENVGFGPSELVVHEALMASPGHRANILHPAFTQIGVGIAWAGSSVWVTQVFRQPTVTSAPVTYQKAPYSPTVYAVTGNVPRALSYAEWAAVGYPSPAPTDTHFVRYAWSESISAVTFWSSGWQWDRLDFASWAAAGYPVPCVAGWIEGSTVWKYRDSDALYLTDPSGATHHLTYSEWAATGFRQPLIR